MEIAYAIGWVALGFAPTLAALELAWRMARRIGKRDATVRVGVAD
ncbi:MAG: hypothetical protein AB1351_01395 [Thermoproteota archaeon]